MRRKRILFPNKIVVVTHPLARKEGEQIGKTNVFFKKKKYMSKKKSIFAKQKP